MTDASVSPQWIDVSQADDLRDVIHRAVACLAQGGVVGLATETVYGLAACALIAESVARVRALRQAELARPLTLLLKGPEEVTDWVPRHLAGGPADGLAAMAGPATLVFARTMADGLYGRLPAEARSPDLPRRRRRPSQPGASDRPRGLAAASRPAGHLDGGDARTSDPLDRRVSARIGRRRYGRRRRPDHYQNFATVVRIDDDRWSIERQGVIDAATLAETSSLIILFVCTGNTCRSPMAEAICKLLLARRLRLSDR